MCPAPQKIIRTLTKKVALNQRTGQYQTAYRRVNLIFQTNGGKTIAENKKGAQSQTVTP